MVGKHQGKERAMEKRSKAYEERLKVYQEVEKIYKYNNRFGTLAQTIAQVKQMTVLAKVYLIMVIHVRNLKEHKKSSRLYDSVTYAYLHAFKTVRDGREYNRDLLTQIRKTLSTVERCVRFIKSDHPDLFSYELIQETNKRRKKSVESYGNESVLVKD